MVQVLPPLHYREIEGQIPGQYPDLCFAVHARQEEFPKLIRGREFQPFGLFPVSSVGPLPPDRYAVPQGMCLVVTVTVGDVGFGVEQAEIAWYGHTFPASQQMGFAIHRTES